MRDLAYEALSPGMRRMLAGPRALHSDRKVADPRAKATGSAPPRCARTPAGARRRPSTRWGDASGDRTQAAVAAMPIHSIAGDERGGEQAAAHLAARARAPPGIHLQLPLARGLDRLWDIRACKRLAVHAAGGPAALCAARRSAAGTPRKRSPEPKVASTTEGEARARLSQRRPSQGRLTTRLPSLGARPQISYCMDPRGFGTRVRGSKGDVRRPSTLGEFCI